MLYIAVHSFASVVGISMARSSGTVLLSVIVVFIVIMECTSCDKMVESSCTVVGGGGVKWFCWWCPVVCGCDGVLQCNSEVLWW